WATQVPRALFARVTGRPDFPPDLADVVAGAELAYRCNAELSFRLGAITATLATRWNLSEPPGGGDTHRAAVRGARSEIRVEQGAETGYRRRLSVAPRGRAAETKAALERAIATWQGEFPGLAASEAGDGWEIGVPRALASGHESHFPLV